MRKGIWFSGLFGNIPILRDARYLGFSKDFPPGRNVDRLGLVFFLPLGLFSRAAMP